MVFSLVRGGTLRRFANVAKPHLIKLMKLAKSERKRCILQLHNSSYAHVLGFTVYALEVANRAAQLTFTKILATEDSFCSKA